LGLDFVIVSYLMGFGKLARLGFSAAHRFVPGVNKADRSVLL